MIGTSCSGAAVAAAPLITDAGMVLISGGNTSPALTSDLAGTAGQNYSVGYYRTAHNDLYQGAAMAKFMFDELGISEAAAIHDGGPYTQGLAQAFADAFEVEGGTVTGFSAVNKDDTGKTPTSMATPPGRLTRPTASSHRRALVNGIRADCAPTATISGSAFQGGLSVSSSAQLGVQVGAPDGG